MQHGISLLPDRTLEHGSARDYFRDAIAIARVAESLGFSHVKMTEHYLHQYGGFSPSPLVYLSAVASVTTRIRLMTGAYIPAFHHPVQAAAELAMLDNISDGRLDAGFGRAWMPYEFEALGLNMAESQERYRDSIEHIQALWTGKSVTSDSRHFSYSSVSSVPVPLQNSPHPPVWGAAARSPESFTWLAEKGFGLLVSLPPLQSDAVWTDRLVQAYLDRFRSVHPDRTPKVAMSLPVLVADSRDAAAERLNTSLSEGARVLSDAVASWSGRKSSGYPGYESMVAGINSLIGHDVRNGGTAVFGTPAECADRISRYAHRYNVDTFLWQVDVGGQQLDEMLHNITRLAEEVVPLIQDSVRDIDES